MKIPTFCTWLLTILILNHSLPVKACDEMLDQDCGCPTRTQAMLTWATHFLRYASPLGDFDATKPTSHKLKRAGDANHTGKKIKTTDAARPSGNAPSGDLCFQDLPKKLLKDILLYLRKEDFKTFRKVSRKCAAVSFDGGTLNARGTEFYLAQKSDLPLLAMHLLKGRCAGVPITCTDLSIADNDLAYLTQAIDVDLRCCTLITDAGLTSLKNTTTINLCGCNIGDAGLVHLEKAKEIILSHCPITDAGLVSLSHAESVNLWKCAFVKDEGLAFLANIHTIDLSYCTITDAGLSHLKRAKDVTLKGCTTLTRNGFAHLANALTVDLSACTQLTNDDLAFFANVEDITLRACNITDAGLLSLQKVKRINLAQCPGVTQGAKDQLRARGVEVID